MSEVLAKTEAIVKKGKALGADEVLAKTVFGRHRQTRFSNNQIDIAVAWNNYVTDVALTWNKRLVATQIRNFQNTDKIMEQLFKLAKVSKENPMYGGIAKGTFNYLKPTADKKLQELEDPAEYVFEAIEAAKKEAGVEVNTGGILYAKYEDVYLASSEGPTGQDARSAIELSIRAFSQIDASGHGVECCSSLRDFKPFRAGEKAGKIARLAKNPKQGEEGKFNVIFDPLFFGSMLGTWGTMASAYSVMIQLSVFVKKLGQKVASDMVTLRDNPAEYSVSNRVFDAEGFPIQENVFIDHGVLKTYLHNTSTAKIFKTKTTGNAGLVQPIPWNIEMDSGDISREELFGEVKRGLYLTNTWYTRFQNYATGDFSTIPRDGIFLIENGEIKQSWKDLRLSDNALRLLSQITGMSKERQHVHWWLEAEPPSLSPYVLAKDIQMTRPK
ncbi:MAG: TldD/PmbA family protein [Candidatus Bathyarchaeota archaeon]|nr:TldD/PmbA family protein [Candidatus Bathyarchaeota archaeon]MDH5494388.1 TldD/PmbA family protein [Candidatus Bathyarchaeota archaeon]